MTTIQLPNQWVPRPHQMPIFNYLENGGKRAMLIAHRRFGKDDILLHWTAVAAFQRVGTYWHCLPEYAQARKAIWTAVDGHTGKRRIDMAFPLELRKSTNETEMKIEFINGSIWQCVGSDEYNSLVGAGPVGITFSEWALANPSAWGYFRPMLQENDGWAAFITTPRGANHAKSMFEAAQKSDQWYAERFTIHDTKALTEEQIEEAKADYIATYGEDAGIAQFEQEYECSFNAAILGAYYGKEIHSMRMGGRFKDFEPIPGIPVHTAWDLGVADSTVIWWFQIVGQKLRILDVYEGNGVGIDHYAKVCLEKPYKRGIDYVPHDAKVREFGTGRTRIETMIACGLNPQLVPDIGIQDGINAVRQTLPMCTFHIRTEAGINALEQYQRSWNDATKTFSKGPNHNWTSHYADAFRYLSVAWIAQAPEKPKDNPLQHVDPSYWLTPPDTRDSNAIRI